GSRLVRCTTIVLNHLLTTEARISRSVFHPLGHRPAIGAFPASTMVRSNEGICAHRRRETWEGVPPCKRGDPWCDQKIDYPFNGSHPLMTIRFNPPIPYLSLNVIKRT